MSSPAGSSIRLIGFAIAFIVAAGSWALTCVAWRFDKVAAGVVPLDPRELERMTLIVLGSAGAWEDPNRRGPAIAVGVGRELVLVDAGRGIAESLRAAKIPMRQPALLLLSSLLPENTVGLDDLLAARWLEGDAPGLRVLGPPGTAALVREVDAALRPAARARSQALGAGEPAAPEPLEVGDGFASAEGDLQLRAGALPGGPVPALAWRFEWRGRSAVVSSAGWAPEPLVAFAQGANLWVHEAAMLPTPEQARELGADADPERLRRQAALHTRVEDVGALAQRIGSQSLLLVRLRPPPVFDLQITSLIGDAYAGRVVIAEDGDEVTP